MNQPQAALLIDTDPGVDDALAILMAHARAEVVGLSIAAGNVGLARTVGNALRLVDLIGSPIPVFAGSPVPLVLPAADAGFVHGADGFGDTGRLPAAGHVSDEHAAAAIVRIAREYAGRLTRVALAPLTNLALALRLDPGLPSRDQHRAGRQHRRRLCRRRGDPWHSSEVRGQGRHQSGIGDPIGRDAVRLPGLAGGGAAD